MRKKVFVGLIATLLTSGVAAQSGFGQRSASGREQDVDLATPALGDIMLNLQLRHIKLWYAGRSGSWDLAEYEVRHLLEGLGRAAVLYSNIPIEQIQAINGPLTDMRAAIKARDAGRFTRHYGELTAACNACHQAGDVGFIRMQTPSSSPFSDQYYPSRP